MTLTQEQKERLYKYYKSPQTSMEKIAFLDALEIVNVYKEFMEFVLEKDFSFPKEAA